MYDKDDVKAAAIGRWAEIINRIGGIDDDYLSSHHGPCPQCGGSDRWRTFPDFDRTGGAICNQCGTFADGFKLLEKRLQCDFKDALQKVGDYLGVAGSKPRRNKPKKQAKHSSRKQHQASNEPPKRDHTKDLDFTVCEGSSIAHFAHVKGTSADAVRSLGAKVARYRHQQIVIAIPMFEEEIDTPTGWVIYDAADGKIPKWNPKTETTEYLKVKVIKQ